VPGLRSGTSTEATSESGTEMTVTAPKGARRAAHAARTAKHAQRTELPARAVADEHDAALAASVAPKQRSRKTQSDVPASAPDTGASKSWQKATAVVEALEPHGWAATVEPVVGHEASEDVLELTARRGTEVLWISWSAGKMTLDPMPTYTVEDRTIKLKNASAVKQYGARPAEVGSEELAKVRANRFFRKTPTEPRRARLPFDPALATDEEVVAALSGKVVSWHNDLSQGTEVAYVNDRTRSARFIKLEERNGDRLFSFVCPQTGFRAFYLTRLVRVGGNPRAFKARRGGEDDD